MTRQLLRKGQLLQCFLSKRALWDPSLNLLVTGLWPEGHFFTRCSFLSISNLSQLLFLVPPIKLVGIIVIPLASALLFISSKEIGTFD